MNRLKMKEIKNSTLIALISGVFAVVVAIVSILPSILNDDEKDKKKESTRVGGVVFHGSADGAVIQNAETIINDTTISEAPNKVPYPIASLDLRNRGEDDYFSQIVFNSNEQPIYISLITDFGGSSPCEGWIDGPNEDADEYTCNWLIQLSRCDPAEIFGEDVSAMMAAECDRLLYIKNPVGDAYNRIKRCKGYGLRLTGFYSIQYVEATHGVEVYEAVPIPVDPERARETHKLMSDSCYSTTKKLTRIKGTPTGREFVKNPLGKIRKIKVLR